MSHCCHLSRSLVFAHAPLGERACQAHMRASVLFSFPGWLCLFYGPARSAFAASTPPIISATNGASRAAADISLTSGNRGCSGTTQQQQEEEEMASTALDFREMMRKERERAMKGRTTATSTNISRCKHAVPFVCTYRSHATMWPAAPEDHHAGAALFVTA